MEVFKLLGTIALSGTEEVKEDLKEAGTHMGEFGKVVGDGITTILDWSAKLGVAVGTAATAIGTLAVKSADDMQNAMNSFASATGVSEDALAGYEETLQSIYNKNFGEGFEDIANSMTTIKQQAGDIGADELEAMTTNALMLRDTFGFEVNESMRAAKMLMDQFNISGQEAFNMIAQGAQAGLDKNGDLLDSINEYSVHYQQLGFDAGQFFNSLQNGTAAGTFSVDKLGDAMKEYGIRVKDGSDTSRQAFEALGYDADEMFQIFNTGGANAATATQDLINRLAEMPDGVEKTTAGVALFGTMWEDLGADGIKALGNLNGSISTTQDALSNINNTKYNNLSNSLSGIKRNLETSLIIPLGNKLIPMIEKMLPTVLEVLDAIMPPFMTIVEELMPVLMDVIDSLMPVLIDVLIPFISDFAENVMPLLVDLFNEILPVIVEIAELVLPILIDLLMQLLPMIIEIVQMFLPVLSELLITLLPPMMQIIEMLLPLLMTILQSLLPVLQPLLSLMQPMLDLLLAFITPLISILNTILPPLIGIIEEVVEILTAILTPAIEKMTEVINFIAPALEAVGGVFADVFNGIKDLWSGVGDFFTDVVDAIKAPFSAIADWFSEIFTTAWQAVCDVFSAAGLIFDGITEAIADVFCTVVNAIIGGINTVIAVPFNAINDILNGIHNIKILNVKPFSGLWDEDPLAVPEIPMLEEGGVLEKGQVGLLEGNGAEAVVPLHNNQKWISKVAEDLRGELGNSDAIINKLDELIKAILTMKIYMNGDVLVGEIAPALDSTFGNMYAMAERGQ